MSIHERKSLSELIIEAREGAVFKRPLMSEMHQQRSYVEPLFPLKTFHHFFETELNHLICSFLFMLLLLEMGLRFIENSENGIGRGEVFSQFFFFLE